MPEYQPMAHIESRDPMVRAYLECAEWCGLMEEDREALELSVFPKWTIQTELNAAAICDMMREDVQSHFSKCYREEERIGRDLWLTRNRHGAGFWDGGWPEPFATEATKWSHAWGDAYVTFDPESETLEIIEG